MLESGQDLKASDISSHVGLDLLLGSWELPFPHLQSGENPALNFLFFFYHFNILGIRIHPLMVANINKVFIFYLSKL